MPVYYTGFNANALFTEKHGADTLIADISRLTKVSLPEVTDIEIGWNFFLLWQDTKLYVTGKIGDNEDKNDPKLIQIPEESSGSCKMAVIGRESIVILSTNHEIWKYNVYDESWQKVRRFIHDSSDFQGEHPVKILYAGCIVVLTNFGRVYNAPLLLEMPKRVKFIDIVCGIDHTILLTENGDVYSMGSGIRGQLGHGTLSNCDNPKLIEALAGLKVVQISAGGWHNAVITDQGDLYTWGWNTQGELGIEGKNAKVNAVPILIDFKNEEGQTVEVNVKKIECGNNFTVCLTDDGSFWGCGTNKYGQLGKLSKDVDSVQNFTKLDIRPLDSKTVKKFKCHQWGMALIVE